MKEDSKKITLLPCACGGKAIRKGRLIECFNRACCATVMRKSVDESITRWNKIMNDLNDVTT